MFDNFRKALIASVVVMALFSSCVKLDGEFALRFPRQDSYRRIHGDVEIRSDTRVEWIYRLNKVPSAKRKIGVFLMRKELVWVEVMSRVDEVQPEKSIIFGTISDLPEGEYKIILTDVQKENRLINSLEFNIYSDQDPED